MVNKILNSVDCIDNVSPNKSKGDVATYYLKLDEKNIDNLKMKKFDADKVKEKFKIDSLISDSFFYVTKGGGTQLKEKWILVETKGKDFKHGIWQLDESLNLFENTKAQFFGRLVTKGVPFIIKRKNKNSDDSLIEKMFEELGKKFKKRNGTLIRGNKVMSEIIISFGNFQLEK